jgi:glycosyltransferase involved in cell wall biosynthesis
VNEPVVSVVMPVHNGERFLAQAIDSVLAQDYPHHEIVLVDDGSTDASGAIAAELPVRYEWQPNQGVAAARNAGVAAARGDLVAFLDQDDLWLPHKLAEQVGYLRERPGVDMVISPFEVLLEPGAEPLGWYRPDWGMDVQLVVQLGALLAWRSAVDRVGAFDGRFEIASDTDWILRARDAGVVLDTAMGVCMRYRMHEHNCSRDQERLDDEVRTAYRESGAPHRALRAAAGGGGHGH